MDCRREFLVPLLRCAEAAYVLDEDTRRVVWVSDRISQSLQEVVGESCWHAFLGKEEPCACCPPLVEGETYAWDYYDNTSARWYKVCNLLFSSGGKRYRAGMTTAIDDVMGLAHDTVVEISELQKLLQENKRIKATLERDISHDRMTGLYNRNRYTLDLASGMFDCASLGVLYFDLNNLKEVNDRYRHRAGDELICRLASVIAVTTQALTDARAYRIGGDEFIIIVKDISEDTLHATAEAFREELARCNAAHEPACSTAIGLAYSPEPCEAEVLVSQADAAMYEAKRQMKASA